MNPPRNTQEPAPVAREDFGAPVKRAIADRAGHRCSNPTCGAPTSGPQVAPDKALNVGVAAHITAASGGGPRYDESMSSEDRCSANNAVWLCQTCAKLVDNDERRFTVEQLIDWKRQAEAAALARIGKATQPSTATGTSEREIRRNLKTRDKLERLMLRPPEEFRGKRITRPYEKFSTHKIVVRSIADTLYPEVDAAPKGRMSSWIVVEPYNFYYGGIELILSIRLVAIDEEGNWAFIEDEAAVDQNRFRIAKAWHIGRIPWRNIREVDPKGDEYYRGPHLAPSRMTACRTKRLWQSNLVTTTIGRSIPQSSGRT